MPPEKFVRPFHPIWPPKELNWPRGFSSEALDLEIGCGVGWHPIQYARANPERSLIAIEHTRAKYERFARRLEHNGPLPNLLAVHADAVQWTSQYLKPRSLDRCFILYPNPEPKAQSARWIRMPYMHKLLELLKPTGELTIATNEAAYAQEVEDWAREYWRLPLIEKRLLTKADRPRTNFEKKYLLRGETCINLRYGNLNA